MIKDKNERYVLIISLVICSIVIVPILILAIWATIASFRSNNAFENRVHSTIQQIKIPDNAIMLREETVLVKPWDIGPSRSYSATYKINGYTREQLADFFPGDSLSKDQSIVFNINESRVQVYLWPAPDWSRMNQLGPDEFYLELSQKPVNEFSITID